MRPTWYVQPQYSVYWYRDTRGRVWELLKLPPAGSHLSGWKAEGAPGVVWSWKSPDHHTNPVAIVRQALPREVAEIGGDRAFALPVRLGGGKARVAVATWRALTAMAKVLDRP